MTPIHSDETMLVTMTKGDLAAILGKIVNDRLSEVESRLTAAIHDADSRRRAAETVVGSRAIAEVIGCNVNTLYREMQRNPRLRAAVKFIGNKRIANRSELMEALRGG